ncbi:MAG TPA: sensor histidine kinase [Chroococcidiopsis sp.]
MEPPLQTWLDRLINETVRLSNLVQDLLDLSQMDRGTSLSLHYQNTDLVALIESAWLSLEPLSRKKQLQFSYLGPDSLIIQADESRLYRVLINLLDNSIKYSAAQQKIIVRLNPDPANPKQVCLDVIDFGPGFPEEALPHVFERFYRVDPSRTRQPANEPMAIAIAPPATPADSVGLAPKSSQQLNQANNPSLAQSLADSMAQSAVQSAAQSATQLATTSSSGSLQRNSSGLGLSIVKQIVEIHGGSVSAANHPESGGAWLTVTLPLKSAYASPKP